MRLTRFWRRMTSTPMPILSSNPGWWIDKTLLYLEAWEVPEPLRLVCSGHRPDSPRVYPVTRMGDSRDRWLCGFCAAEWFDLQPQIWPVREVTEE